MPIRTCPDSTPCPPDQPLDNFSAEADDTIDYISTRYGGGPPPLLHNFTATQCGVTYVSQISQLDADLQAAAAAQTCANNNPNLPIIFNSPQTCCVPCPDGTPTCYTLPGGLFPAPNQASADALAHQVACDLVNRNKVCLGSISGCTCVGLLYSSTVTSNVPATLSLSAGSLPPGVAISFGTNSATLIGVPLVLGQYTFQIKAQTAAGPYSIKTFTITVLQIVTTSLPPFTVGTPYSFQLLVAGGSGNYAWKLTSGTLPPGITLSLSGLLSGTPTASGTNPLQFTAIDQTCESTDQSFFPPSLTMATKSTTQIATVIGFPEYPGFVSTPPKRYHTLTWSGSSEQQLWFPANSIGNSGPAYQIAGARFDYAGSSSIDSQGNYTSIYTKNRSEMCISVDGLINTFLNGVQGGLENYPFLGWIGPTGHTKCPLPGTPYDFVSNDAVGKGDLAISDGSPFWGSKQPSPLSAVKVSNFNPATSTTAVCVDSGGDKVTAAFIALFEPVQQGVVPPITGDTQGTVWFFGAVVWNHNYSATLSAEYTDAEALANAQVIQGNGATAQNFPRTTGFVSTFTNVVYTLSLSNLIVGTAYTVSVDLWNPSTGATTTKQYPVTATSSTFTITDIVPTPSPQGTVQVRNPRIVFT